MEGIVYREDFKMWWPTYDHKPEKCYQFVMNGLPAMDETISISKRRDVCVQAGGHAGAWPKKLASFFKDVYTFEPERMLFECLMRNCRDMGGIHKFSAALGSSVSTVRFKSHQSAGSWRVDPNGEYEVDCTTIDALNLPACDAILLDIEGYEVEALKGAAFTINKFSPVLHVEELPRSKDAIQAHMQEIGYVKHRAVGRDVIYRRR